MQMMGMDLLQINFSQSVENEILQVLHTEGLDDKRVSSIEEIIEEAGGEKLNPVYKLSAEEIIHDNYGFARTFKVYLKPGIDAERAIKILQSSPLVEKVKPVGINKTFNC
ncbi:hypothetical protein ACLFKQ_01690 [Myxosarcina sp. GI1(2024)]